MLHFPVMSAAMAQPLDAQAVARACARPDLAVECIARTESTQADLVARVRALAPLHPVLRAAGEQDAGRGRMGRPWISSPGGSLLFSLSLPWTRSPSSTPAVTLACATAVARALEARGVPVRLQWPNDILLGGAKLAGILVELAQDPAGATTLVVGLGCNLWLDAKDRELLERERRVADLAQSIGRERLEGQREAILGELAGALLAACERYREQGFAPFREDFLSRFALLHQPVQLLDEARAPRTGIARDIDEQGRLLIEGERGLLAVHGGELRALDASRPHAPAAA